MYVVWVESSDSGVDDGVIFVFDSTVVTVIHL